MRFLPFLLTCCLGAAQSVSFGVVGGARPTDDVPFWVTPESRRYVVGPSVELGLPFHFAVEVDALYHREGYRYEAPPLIGLSGVAHENERANSWEFPILLKYKLAVPLVKPFVEAGLAPRRITGTSNDEFVVFNCCGPDAVSFGSTKTDSSSLGVVAGGGVRFSIGRLSISPEARYTYWTSASTLGPTGVYTSQWQVDVLVAIAWKVR